MSCLCFPQPKVCLLQYSKKKLVLWFLKITANSGSLPYEADQLFMYLYIYCLFYTFVWRFTLLRCIVLQSNVLMCSCCTAYEPCLYERSCESLVSPRFSSIQSHLIFRALQIRELRMSGLRSLMLGLGNISTGLHYPLVLTAINTTAY